MGPVGAADCLRPAAALAVDAHGLAAGGGRAHARGDVVADPADDLSLPDRERAARSTLAAAAADACAGRYVARFRNERDRRIAELCGPHSCRRRGARVVVVAPASLAWWFCARDDRDRQVLRPG